jgi:hypothetical protein
MRFELGTRLARLFVGSVTAAALVTLLAPTAQAGMRPTAGAQPREGMYQYASLLVSTSGSCGIQPGLQQLHVFYYPGPNRPGAKYVAEGIPYVVAYSLYPTTPPAGVTTWSGNYTTNHAPGGQTGSGTFNATFQFFDPDFFLATETDVQSGCTQNWQATYVRI